MQGNFCAAGANGTIYGIFQLDGNYLQIRRFYLFPKPHILTIEILISSAPAPAQLIAYQLFLEMYRFQIGICQHVLHRIIADQTAVFYHHAGSIAFFEPECINVLSSIVVTIMHIPIMSIAIELKIIPGIKTTIFLSREVDRYLTKFIAQFQIAGVHTVDIPTHFHLQ